MNTSPHLLTAFLIQVVLATIYQNGPLCPFRVLSYDLTNPLSHLFQVCAVVMLILEMGKLRLGQGKQRTQNLYCAWRGPALGSACHTPSSHRLLP